MDDHILKTLEQAKRKLSDQEAAVITSKKFINQLCEFGGVPPMYPNVGEVSASAGLGSIQRDSFYGKSVTTAAREYLEMRKASGLGAASHAEIIEALKAGGFDFLSVSSDEMVAQRAVAITLGKNSGIFHKLPNGNWGLLAWYPEAKERKQKRNDSSAQSSSAGAVDDQTSPSGDDSGAGNELSEKA